MDVHLEVSDQRPYLPFRAILVYSNGQDARATVHDLIEVGGAPELGAATPLTTHDLQAIVAQLGSKALTFHPQHVLASSVHAVAWWEPAQDRPLFFSGSDPALKALSGQRFPQPPLLMVARPRSLSVFALPENARPTPGTPVCRSPYYNVYEAGNVCVGSVPYPDVAHGENTHLFSEAFFQSNFTHNSTSRRLTRFGGSHAELWLDVQARGEFPMAYLEPLEKTVAGVVR